MAADLTVTVMDSPVLFEGDGIIARVYEITVTQWLRRFYFKGPVWRGVPPEEICFQLTGEKAEHWTRSNDNMADCAQRIEQQFEMWDSTIMTVLWFALLAFVVFRMLHCIFYCEFCLFFGECCLRKRLRKHRDYYRDERRRQRSDQDWSCSDSASTDSSDFDSWENGSAADFEDETCRESATTRPRRATISEGTKTSVPQTTVPGPPPPSPEIL